MQAVGKEAGRTECEHERIVARVSVGEQCEAECGRKAPFRRVKDKGRVDIDTNIEAEQQQRRAEKATRTRSRVWILQRGVRLSHRTIDGSRSVASARGSRRARLL